MTLLEELSNKDFLFEAWNQLKKENEDSHGLSGLTIKEFQENLTTNIFNIRRFLKKGSYNFSPNRAAVIKKENGKYRPLQIPEIRDRVVLKALAILLEENLKELLKDSEGISYAYQKGKGVKQAVLQMKSVFDQGKQIILKADIVNFFEEVDKDSLLKNKIFPNLKDKTINFLIINALNQKLGGLKRLGKKHKELFKNAGKGIPQGNPLSPLLSNVYLADFDSYMKNENHPMVRYADDFIVLFDNLENAEDGYNHISEYLTNELGLEIHELDEKDMGKTTIVNPFNQTLSFLSIRFDGKKLLPPRNSIPYLKSKIAKEVKRGELNEDTFNSVYTIITNWIALYSYLEIDIYFDAIDNYFVTVLKKKFGYEKIKTTNCKKLKARYFKERSKKNKAPFWKKILPSFSNSKSI
ncbi:reverse transcriptase domain-containing protein [Maribacter polysaccharolyticus]|uniref:reverse transcriptase domain-containing protein n=1 Tax=Maribacter polysaccharolyticus TaxID=3020831 RepID=UPI00237F8035|nr:reverse transcriptase domain-containing protein [Maribacter polysaccharolyticus]MDE3741175.1 reverse transcriptase domain-containing protein [Maribacter polysaccharolyticus]